MALLIKVALLVLLAGFTVEAVFMPRCLTDGILPSRMIRDTLRESRPRRFLWTNQDVCDTMCTDRGRSYIIGLDNVCRRCCAANTPATATTPRYMTTAGTVSTGSTTASTASSSSRSLGGR